MKYQFVLLAVILSLTLCVTADLSESSEDQKVITPELVSLINSLNVGWESSTEQGAISGVTVGEARTLACVLPGGPKLTRNTYETNDIRPPTSFDSRKNWPSCWTMNQIRDQSACGSCWAFGTVEAISDRYCVSKVNQNLSISAQDMNSCCGSCGYGCGGGYPSSAWSYWTNKGVVSEACSPYSLPSCDHHIPHSKNPCPTNEYPTPACVKTCKDGEIWNNAKHFGKTSYALQGENDIMKEIYTNGPVQCGVSVYADFLSYKSGVYKYTSGDFLGGHAMKILGWGVDKGEKYWLVANSWNPDWGDKGYIKILKGVDEIGIESDVNAGIPKN